MPAFYEPVAFEPAAHQHPARFVWRTSSLSALRIHFIHGKYGSSQDHADRCHSVGHREQRCRLITVTDFVETSLSTLGRSVLRVFAVGHTWLDAVPGDLADPARAARH